MRESYGVIGSGSASRKVIESSLNDIGIEPTFIIPWYGKVTEGLETVYDWVIDNNATFSIIAKEGVKDVPKALAKVASSVLTVDDVDSQIVKLLNEREVKGLALILWDQDKESYSSSIASMAIDLNIPTLELTNGLVPIIMDEDVSTKEEEDPGELPDIGEADYERETLEMMPTALVKRMAKDRGYEPKSKEDAVNLLSNKGEQRVVSSIVVLYQNGTEVLFNGSAELLKKMVDLIESFQDGC